MGDAAVPVDGPDAFGAVDEVLDRGYRALLAGRPEEARGDLEEALGLLDHEVWDDPAGRDGRRARVLGLLAMVVFESDGATPALALLDAAAEAAEAAAAGDAAASAAVVDVAGTADAADERAALVALTWSQRATVLGRSGAAAAALAAFDRAAEHLDALRPRDRAVLLLNRGVARSQVDDLVGAVADLEQAAVVAAAHGLVREQFMATHNLGYLHHVRGDDPAALRAMEHADALDAEVSRGVALLDRGRVLLELGLADDAEEVLARAVEVCQRDGQLQAAAEAEYELALVARLHGRPDESLARLASAHRRFEERGSATWTARCRLVELSVRVATIDVTGGDAPSPAAGGTVDATTLAEDCRSLATTFDEAGSTVLARAARVLAAEASARAGHVAQAVALLPHRRTRIPQLSVMLAEQRARAAVAMARDDHDGARRQLARAADRLARASVSATTLELRTARSAHARLLARLDLVLHLDDPVGAVAAVDRWRAASGRLPPVRPETDGDTVGDLLVARRRLHEVLREAPDDDAAWQRLAHVEDRIATRRRTTRPTDLSGDPAPVTTEELAAALADADADLLVLAVVDHDALAILVGDDGGTVRRIGAASDVAATARRLDADLRQLAGAPDGPLHDAVERSLRRAAGELGHLLLDGRTSGRRLVVSPNAPLAGLPWGLLAPGRPVVLARSPTDWVRRRTTGRRVADDVRVLRGPHLVAAATEVEAVAAAWDAPVPAADATAADLVDALAAADLVHVAAHGRHHREHPLFSSLALADGVCCLYDVETTGVRSRLVVLASCDGADATARPGGEPLGLATGLLALGAGSVVAPVAPVPDERLPAVMARLHDALARGVAVDEALVEAAQVDPVAAAPFVVAGSGPRLR